MFEDSLFSSGISLDKQRSARRIRRFALASIALQLLILAAFLAVPLVFPESLPLLSVAPKPASLLLKRPSPRVEPKRLPTSPAAASMPAPSPTPQRINVHGGSVFVHGSPTVEASSGPVIPAGNVFGAGSGPIPGIGSSSAAPTVVTVTPKRTEPLAISSGVTQGMLLAPITPTYPPIARAAKVQGTVVLTAVIDKQGHITGLRVLSGPPMLQNAALDAVSLARYRPFLLNGQPTDITTTIQVNFRLGYEGSP
jgi:protein TonB